MSSQTTSSIQKKFLKEGEKPKSSSSSKSCRICTCSFAWGILARLLTYLQKIFSEGFTWCGTRQLQWAWSQLNCLMENLCSITTCFGVLHPKILMLPSKNYLVFCLSNQPKYVVLCWQNNGRNPKFFHCSICSFRMLLSAEQWNICTICIFFCHRDTCTCISNIPQSQSAKLQHHSTEVDEQQPLSVHLWEKKRWNVS